jgi:hypothetical protein
MRNAQLRINTVYIDANVDITRFPIAMQMTIEEIKSRAENNAYPQI